MQQLDLLDKHYDYKKSCRMLFYNTTRLVIKIDFSKKKPFWDKKQIFFATKMFFFLFFCDKIKFFAAKKH